MSNNPLQPEYFHRDEEMNEEAERQAAREAGARALPHHPRLPGPNPDPATAPIDIPIGMEDVDMPAQGGAETPAVAPADVQMGMDNSDIPAQRGAENPAPGAGERAQDGALAPRAEPWQRGTNEGTGGPVGRTGAEVMEIDAIIELKHTGTEAIEGDIGVTMEATTARLTR